MLTFGSLFAGIGGLDLGLERAGMECKWQVEIDDYATKVLTKHWPDIPKHRDITKIIEGDLCEVDLICGGFPCQDISCSGKRKGLDGERSGLFFELMRVVRLLRPKYVLLENVPGLFIRGFGQVLSELAQSGYDAQWNCFPTGTAYGHERKRVFIVSYANGNRLEKMHTNEVLRIQADNQKDTGHTRAMVRKAIFQRKPERNALLFRPKSFRSDNGIPCRMDRLRCLGNAVVPKAAEFVGKCIIDFDRKTNDTL